VLTLYRRHKETCKNAADRYYRKCKCAVWAEGTVETKYVRRSLKTRSWERGEEIKRQIENGTEPAKQVPVTTVESAVDAFVADGIARNLNRNTIAKYKLLSGRLKDFADENRIADIREFTNAHAIAFRGTWKGAPRTQAKTLERFRSFFGFCVQNDWITKNPAKGIKAPTIKPSPTLPFSHTEVTDILKNADFRSQVFFRLLLHSGLRIMDAAQLRPERIEGGKLFLYTQKTGTAVKLPLPPDLIADLAKLTLVGGFYFVVESELPSSVAEYYRVKLGKAATKVKVKGAHPHRFRDTFAVRLLEKGVPLETVSVLLGHTDLKTTQRSYSPWVKSLQDNLEAAVQRTW